MIKKITALVFVLTLSFSLLTACGTDPEPKIALNSPDVGIVTMMLEFDREDLKPDDALALFFYSLKLEGNEQEQVPSTAAESFASRFGITAETLKASAFYTEEKKKTFYASPLPTMSAIDTAAFDDSSVTDISFELIDTIQNEDGTTSEIYRHTSTLMGTHKRTALFALEKSDSSDTFTYLSGTIIESNVEKI